MPTDSNAAATTTQPRSRRVDRVWRDRLSRVVFWCVVLVLVGFNAWWLIRDLWLVPELGTIHRMIARHEMDEAERGLRRYLRRWPRHGEARILLSRLLARRGDRVGCADELHKVPYWWPGKREAQFMEGQSYFEANRARQAELAWRGCVKDDPLHPTSREYVNGAAKQLIALYLLEHRLPDARVVLWDAYQQAEPSERPAILGTRIRVEIERIDPKEAVATLSRYVSADPDDWQARRALALALQDVGQPAEADRRIRQCLEAWPDDPDVWLAWLTILALRNDSSGLTAAVNQMPSTVLRKGNSLLWQYRGMALESSGQLEEARTSYREAIRLDPFDEQAHFRLARVEQRLGHSQEAGEHRERHRVLQEARSALPAAMARYREVARKDTSHRAELAEATRRLASLSETLGWSRLAEAWRKLVPPGY